MSAVPGGWKFLYAFSLPALLIACAIVGADDMTGYRLVATVLIFVGAICAGRTARGNRYAIGTAYFVAIELLMLFLP